MTNIVRPIIFGFVLLALGSSVSTVNGQDVRLRFEQYEEKLNAILKTRRDEEKAFVAAVVQRIRDGDIPERLVETSFQWVRNKRPNTNYPFVYFERVLRLQAQKLELAQNIPAFDYEIYNTRISRRRNR